MKLKKTSEVDDKDKEIGRFHDGRDARRKDEEMVKKDAAFFDAKADEAAERARHFCEIEQKYREQAQELREKERIERITAFAEAFEQALAASGVEQSKLTPEVAREAAAGYIATREVAVPAAVDPREEEKQHD